MQLLNYYFPFGMRYFLIHFSPYFAVSNMLFFFERLPFDYKNPVGFLTSIAMQYIMFSYAMKIGTCVIALAIGFYLYLIAMQKCIKQNLAAIERHIQSKTEQKFIRNQLIEYIQFDSKVKRWAHSKIFIKFNMNAFLYCCNYLRLINDFSDVFQHFITIVFIWSLVTICGALLMVQLTLVQSQ